MKLGGGDELTNMVAVGRTDHRSVRLWFRSEVAGRHAVEITPFDRRRDDTRGVVVAVATNNRADNTCSLCYPDDFAGQADLEPISRYRFSISRVSDGTPLGEGRFETAPATLEQTPDRFSIGLCSCHQPFNDDGALSPRRGRMLGAAQRALRDHDAKLVVMAGDQIYSDSPGDFSLFSPHYFSREVWPGKAHLFECDAAEVRAVYQQRYRTFWAMPKLRKIYAEYPCYPMLDDHEIVDDWGSRPEHSAANHRPLLDGARQAYFDYQGSRVAGRTARLPSSFDYSFDYGRLGVFVMDLRSQRRVTRSGVVTIYRRAQLRALQRFLQLRTDRDVLAIVVSVPLVHITSFVAELGHSVAGDRVDFLDHWSFPANLAARDALLGVLHDHQRAHPRQRVLLLGGDVHIGSASLIRWRGGNKPILYQLTSSALTNRIGALDAYLQWIGMDSVTSIRLGADGPRARVELIRGETEPHNPFGGPNLGILELHRRGDRSTVRYKLVSYADDGARRPLTVFDTGEI